MEPPASDTGRPFDDSVVFAGGRLCLDFVNTACERRGEPLEFLGHEAGLRRWLDSAQTRYGSPHEDIWSLGVEATSLAQAHELRVALRDLVDGILQARQPSESALQTVNAFLGAAPSVWRLEFTEAGYRRRIHTLPGAAPWLAEIAKDAVDFLCHADLSLLRQCGCETCVRVFYDTTKNHKRRWCVEKCGSRIKSARYYQRKRQRAKESS